MTLVEQISLGLHDEGSFKRMFKPKDMKLFPFESFQSFSQQNDKGEENPHLHCSYCGVDLTESGNGKYYTGYIVFESEKEVKLSCRHTCLPKGCLSHYDQQFGFREPLQLPEKFKNSLPHIVVFDHALSGKKFEFNKYRKTGITLKNLSDYFSTFGGGANGKYQHNFKKGKLEICVNWELKYQLTKAQIVKIANEIIMQQDQPKEKEVKLKTQPMKTKTDKEVEQKIYTTSNCTECCHNTLKLVHTEVSEASAYTCMECKTGFAFKAYRPKIESIRILTQTQVNAELEAIKLRQSVPKVFKTSTCSFCETSQEHIIRSVINNVVELECKQCGTIKERSLPEKKAAATAQEIQTAVDNFNKPREAARAEKAQQAATKKQLSYPGGKNGAGTYQEIICQFPPHRRYIELFLGSGAIINRKKPALENYGVELNRSTIDKFTYTSAATIIHADVYTWLQENRHLIDKHTLIYLDPPYPLDAIKSQLPLYEKHLSDENHHHLLRILLELPAMIVISSYENEIYNSHLKNWRKHFYQNTTRQGLATECLYMNYPEPTELHDYNFLGKNFTDRQRIKRKITREIKKLLALPALERNAIISEIQDINQ